ncbi:hypothetical protein ACFYZ9_35350 [Streptomyces sp. NPDC001691]|uniref:hypothetical protein n=1 Tax=Streptomyces sp. NPDC001691 TaxID=3364600 RepID=UPI003676E054
MSDVQPVTSDHIHFILDRTAVGVPYALIRHTDGSLDYRPAGGYPDQPSYEEVWDGCLLDLGDGWEETADGRLTDRDAALAAEILNELS